jgi:hypothetical protein
MRIITYNDEAAPWSRCNHLMGTRLLPSSDDRDNNIYRNLWNPWTEMMVNQTTPVTGTVYVHLCPLLPILCLFKLKLICVPQRWLKMG